MSNETTTGPYTVERNGIFNEWRVIFSGLPRLTFASEKQWICIRVCESLNTAYAAGQASREQQWIPVSERTPELPIQATDGSRYSERVLVYRSLAPKHMQVGEATYADFGQLEKGWMGESGNGITHWQHLPSPPNKQP